MARIDLNKYKAEMVKAYQDVSDPKSPTDWSLFSYEGKSNVLKLVGTGDGGIEELTDDLSGGKIMYAFCKVKDPNTELPKFVLINWQGEGVPEIRKGSCANHIRDVEGLFRGFHITLMARSEDDVDEDDIKKRVAKSSGANFGFHKEKARPDEGQIGPVGTNYKKVQPQREIQGKKREDFWEKQQEEEKRRIQEESQKKNMEASRLDQDRREREAREASERESRESDRVRKIQAAKQAEQRANQSKKPARDWDQEQAEAAKDADERSRRSEQMRKERAAEAAQLIGGSKAQAKSVFEQRTSQFDAPSGAPPPPRKIKHSFGSQENPETAERKAPIELPKAGDASPPPSGPCPSQPKVQRIWEEEGIDLPDYDYSPKEPAPRPVPPTYRAPTPVEPEEPQEAPEQPAPRNLLAQGLPQRQKSESEEEEEDQNWEDEGGSVPQAVVSPTSGYGEQENLYESCGGDTQQQQQQVVEEEAGGEVMPPTGQENTGQCARALYDYQAVEANEITFDPDDILTNIEQIDSGWWIGTAPDGNHGMFPANYVELI